MFLSNSVQNNLLHSFVYYALISSNSTSVIVIESVFWSYFPSLTLNPTEKLFNAPSLIKECTECNFSAASLTLASTKSPFLSTVTLSTLPIGLYQFAFSFAPATRLNTSAVNPFLGQAIDCLLTVRIYLQLLINPPSGTAGLLSVRKSHKLLV